MLQRLSGVPLRADIESIHEAIKPSIHRTPVLQSQSTNQWLGASIFFKCENFQKIGAFKMRGAMSAALTLSEEDKRRGVATHSSGNHAQALALSARQLGIPAYIVMPTNAPKAKREATKGYGATIIDCEPNVESREQTLLQVIERTGAFFVPPYNDYNVIAGQATAAKELMEDVEGLDVVIAPIGGGGLMSGTALWAHYASPSTRIVGAEPEAVNDAYRSLQAGKILTNTSTDTIADGLRTNLGDKTFGIISQYVKEIICVSEQEIMETMRWLWSRLKIVVEPSGAVSFAAAIKVCNEWQGKRIGVILSGGNVDAPL